MDFIPFWSEMMLQHMLFLSYLAKDFQRKKEADKLAHSWEKIVIENNNPNLSETSYFREEIIELLQQTLIFKLTLLHDKKFHKSRYIPNKSLDKLIEHMILELKYFNGLLHNDLSTEEELTFLARESSQHEKLVLSTLLNPRKDIKREVKEISRELRKESLAPSSDLRELLEKANSSLEEIENLLLDGELESRVPEAMIQHELDEGEWEKERLNKLLHE